MKAVLKRVTLVFISFLMVVAMLPQISFADETDELFTSFTIEDFDIVENTFGWEVSEVDMETGGTNDYFYYYPLRSSWLKATVVYNGQEYTGDMYGVANFLGEMTGSYPWPSITIEQSYNNQWEPGGTYPATISIMGREASFHVTVLPSPLTLFEIEDLDIVENTFGSQYSDHYHYYPEDASSLKVRIICDGQEYTGNMRTVAGIIAEKTGDGSYSSFITNQSAETPWVLGGTYPVKAKLLNQEANFNVTIVDSPLSVFEIEDVEIADGTYGVPSRYWDEETESYVYYYHYYPENIRSIKVSIVYEGQEYSGTPNEISRILQELTGESQSISYRYDSYYNDPWKVGGVYPVTASLLGKKTTFNISITESPFKVLSIDDIEIAEGSCGYLTKDSNGMEYWRYDMLRASNLVFHITYYGKNYSGTQSAILSQIQNQTGEWKGDLFSGYYYDSGQSYENQWKVGETHDVTVLMPGGPVSFNVKIIKSLVSDFTVQNLEIMDGTCSYQRTEYSYNPYSSVTYWYYDLTNSLKLKMSFVYKGKRYSGSRNEILNQIQKETGELASDLFTSFAFSSDQSYSNQWKAGEEHEVTAVLQGNACSFKVKITKNLLESFQIDNLKISEGASCGYRREGNTEPYLYYDFNNSANVTIVYNGQKYSGTSYYIQRILYEFTGENVMLNYVTDQSYENQWTKGQTHTVQATLLKRDTQFNVTIKESPFISIEAENVTIQEGKNAYTVTNILADGTIYTFNMYSYFPKVTLTTRKGEKITRDSGMGSSINYNGEMFPVLTSDDQLQRAWGLGEHTATVLVGGLRTNIKVNIVDLLFDDVQNPNAWYYDTVYTIAKTKNANGKALMSGYGDGSRFGPADPLTRQDFAVILYRLADEPYVEPMANPFKDTNPNGYYYTCVLWAKADKVIAGYNDGRFGVGDKITREQVATILYRFAKDYMDIDTSEAYAKGDLTKFKDGKAISSWAEEALTWATGAGVITGKDNGTRIDARGNAARAEIGAMILRFIAYIQK